MKNYKKKTKKGNKKIVILVEKEDRMNFAYYLTNYRIVIGTVFMYIIL